MSVKAHPAVDVVGRRVAAGTIVTNDFTYSVIEPGPGTIDRRNDRRLRSHLREGLVAERRGRVVADCRIRDMSKRGARLQLDKDRPLPKAFILTEGGTKRTYWAILVWQAGRDAGVRLMPVD